jgi:hypothetical protein
MPRRITTPSAGPECRFGVQDPKGASRALRAVSYHGCLLVVPMRPAFSPKLRRLAGVCRGSGRRCLCAFDRHPMARVALFGALDCFVASGRLHFRPYCGFTADALVLATAILRPIAKARALPWCAAAPRTRRREPQDWAREAPLRGSSDLTGVDCRTLPQAKDIHRVKVTTHTSLMNGRDFLI